MNSGANISSEDIALSFHDLGISTISPSKTILQNVSGYVIKGGITAILGASPSGKSVLLNVLGGRMPGFRVKGQITYEGMNIDPHDLKNEISCVPASDQDFLASELTPRETLMNTLLLKKGGINNDIPEIMKEVDNLLNVFSLNHVADVPIGFVLELGLLGGERKRVEVCSELISSHPVLLLDEPTSGLDGCIAYEVLVGIKKMIRQKKGELSILLTIHQPNRRILDLFDHILLLGRGGTMHFFGTVSECMDYFTSIGFPPSVNYTPTDVFLQMTDSHFGSHREMNFEGLFACSTYASNLHLFLSEVERKGNLSSLKKVIVASSGGVVGKNGLDLENSESRLLLDPFHDVPLSQRRKSKRNAVRPTADPESECEMESENASPLAGWLDTLSTIWNQYRVLLYRDFTIAYRDRSLYFLQLLASIGFGFFVGAVFFKLEFEVSTLVVYIQLALSWIVMILCYTQVFKIYHLTRGNIRFKHERSNNAYSPAIAWWTELTTTAIMVNVLLPGVFIALAMMNVPQESYPFFVILSWMTALTAESMFYLITKFTDNPSISVVIAQAILVVLTVFEGGVFIAWQTVPDYWYWLQELSIFTQSSRAAIMNVNDFVTYPCQLQYGKCITVYGVMPCDASPATGMFGTCEVQGRSLLHTMTETSPDESKWVPFAYIVLMFGIFRLTALFLMYYPWEMILGKVKHLIFGYPSSDLLECQMELKNVKNQLVAVVADRRRVAVSKKSLEMEKVHSSSASTTALVSTATHSISNELNDDKGEETRLVSLPTENDESKNMANTYSNLATGYKRLNFAPGACAIPKAKTAPASAGDAIVNDVSTATLVNYFNFDENLHKENEKNKKDKKRFYCLEWYNLSVTLKKNDRVLIDNVSGCALPGRILAIMGPSGAGKTTLLRGLTNRAPFARISGQIVFGKREFSSRDLMLVPQYDEFNANLTVYEMIEFIGHMKCADSSEMYTRLFSLLKILGLTNKAHALCSELTSGELKRVSVGMGMIANPNVLFLDEPTRGLDSTAAFAIVNYLSDLSKSTNVVIVMSIHQPAQIVFDKLQDLYLIGKEGRLAYFGPSNCATKYFEKYGFYCPGGLNAVDFYLDLIANPYPKNCDIESGGGQKKVTSWQGLYAQSTLYQNIEVIMEHAVLLTTKAHEPPPLPSYFSRLWQMMKFFFHYYSRDLRLYYLRYAFLVICGVFIGTLFFNLTLDGKRIRNYIGCGFFCIWIILYSVVASTGIYATDRRQTMELVKNAVIAPSFYCIAQFIVSIPFNLFGAVLFQSIFHWLTNIQPTRRAFFYAIMITFGQLMMMESIMFTLVAWCKSALLSVTSAVVVLAYLFLFSGFINPTAMPVWIRWLCDISPVYYSFRGYMWEMFSNRMIDLGERFIPSEFVLNLGYGIRDLDSWKLFGALIGWVFCYRFVHFLLLLYESWPFLKAPSLETRTKKKTTTMKHT